MPEDLQEKIRKLEVGLDLAWSEIHILNRELSHKDKQIKKLDEELDGLKKLAEFFKYSVIQELMGLTHRISKLEEIKEHE